MQPKKARPRIAKGKKEDAVISCVGWLDLLGYGSTLRSVGFDPRDATSQQAVERLSLFHSTLALNVRRSSQMVIMNDGAVVFDDLSQRARSVSFEFLKNCIGLYQCINEVDQGKGFPGARMVIATGFRMTMQDRSRMERTAGESLKEPKLANILDRLKKSQITSVRRERGIQISPLGRFD